jgi:hypothetical protein
LARANPEEFDMKNANEEQNLKRNLPKPDAVLAFLERSGVDPEACLTCDRREGCWVVEAIVNIGSDNPTYLNQAVGGE